VLSVVAQQVFAITNGKRNNSVSFTFPDESQEILLNDQVGYFITMNPVYQGGHELPENLKALFRGVASLPDHEIIIKVKLCSGLPDFYGVGSKVCCIVPPLRTAAVAAETFRFRIEKYSVRPSHSRPDKAGATKGSRRLVAHEHMRDYV